MDKTDKLELKSYKDAKKNVEALKKRISKNQEEINGLKHELEKKIQESNMLSGKLAVAAEWLVDIIEGMND